MSHLKAKLIIKLTRKDFLSKYISLKCHIGGQGNSLYELLDYEGKRHKISSEEYAAWTEVLYRGKKPTSLSCK